SRTGVPRGRAMRATVGHGADGGCGWSGVELTHEQPGGLTASNKCSMMGAEGVVDMRAATTRPSRARAGGAVLRVAAAPVPAPVRLRLGQGDEELLCARLASRPADRLLHGHLAGLRFASAVVARHGRPAGRPAPRSVWDMLERVEPSLSEWAGFF